MPTPSDSTDELRLPPQIDHLLHSSCPPDIDRPAEWRTQVLERLSRAGFQTDTTVNAVAVAASDDNPSHPQRPNADEESSTSTTLGTEEDGFKMSNRAIMEDVDNATSTMASESPPSGSVEDKPIEEKEEEQTQMTTPTSSILDLPYSSRLGLHSSRVCGGRDIVSHNST